MATVDGLDAGQGVTLYATAGSRLAAAPALPVPRPAPPTTPAPGRCRRPCRGGGRPGRGRPGLVWSAGPARAGGPGRRRRGAFARPAGPRWARDPGRRRDLAGLATVEFVPPRELTPAQGGVLLAEAVRPEHQVAWLIGAAVDGYLDLEDSDGQVTLVRRPRRDGPAAYLLDSAFEGRDRLSLGSYDEDFALAWRSLGRELGAWERASGLWDRPATAAGRARALACRRGGRGAAGRPERRLGPAVGPGWLAGGRRGLLAGAGAAAAVRAWELRVRTPAGSGCGCGRVVPAVPGRLRGPHAEEAANAATCASTPPGRSRWASWTVVGAVAPPRWPPPTRWPPATR